MPRQARLDIPGLLQHVIVRGIERRNIFRDNTDRRDFCKRFSALLVDTRTDCFAWALIPNHFHLLLRTNTIELKDFMRRLLTGYAVTFNKRHHRAGHVFQNRYKSIVCEDDPYFLELVRYIHLNPLRAKIVADLERLNRYQWCGHSVLMGTNALVGQGADDVLAAFGKNTGVARKKYLKFIADGIPQGRRDELVGGGLKRSRTRLPDIDSEPESYDERVLGGGSFVDQLRREEELLERMYSGMTLSELIDRVEKYFHTEPGQLDRRIRDPIHQKARDIFCVIAVKSLGHSGTEAGSILNIRRSAVSHAVRRGNLLLAETPSLKDEIFGKPSD